MAIDRAATIVALVLLKKQAAAEVEKKYLNDFLNNLVNGEIDSRETVLQRGVFFNLDLTLPYLLFLIDIGSFAALKVKEVQGVLETAPGIRSLLIKYDGFLCPLKKLLEKLYDLERSLPPLGVAEVSSRVVYLPIAYHDRWNKIAIERYMKTISLKQ